MEYVHGVQLESMIGPGGLPVDTFLRYSLQIADALIHAHDRGVVHRDLKSANVIIGTDGRLNLLDFGLAHRLPEYESDNPTQSIRESPSPRWSEAATGKRAAAVARLRKIRDDAKGFAALELESDMVLSEVETASGQAAQARTRPEAVETQARSRGFLLIANQANAARR